MYASMLFFVVVVVVVFLGISIPSLQIHVVAKENDSDIPGPEEIDR